MLLSRRIMIYSDTQTPTAESAEIPNASTGPRTDAGKAVSSRNAVKHNLCSKRLTGSDLEEFKALRTQLEDEWDPQTETERLLLDQMALCRWRIDRALSLELNAFDDDHLDPALLALALRYRTTAERGFYKALAELQRLRGVIRQDAIRQQKAADREYKADLTAALDYLYYAPIGAPPPPQFVSQSQIPPDKPSSRSSCGITNDKS
ncbi:MAG TPA: hypothetical protein VN633_02985 [Bryobacteraceae bacterium]|nr:hypothetical protein [Bryobacteraceae bacterium]